MSVKPCVIPAVYGGVYAGVGGVRGGKPLITGTAYPSETLTSTRAGQWYANGVAISGETAATYVVRLGDIGKAITQTGSNTKTIWHPNTIAGVARFWSSLSNVYNTVSPDVAATNGQAVRRWNGIISGTQADQTTGVNQPLYRATGQNGNPSLEFDGSNDFLSLPTVSNVLQNKTQAYLLAGIRDTLPSAGSGGHPILTYTINGSSTSSRLALFSRFVGAQNFSAVARRQDANASAVAVSANNGNYNVLAAHGDFSNGFVRLRVNGSVTASTALASGSGSTSDTTSNVGYIANAGAGDVFPGHIACACVVNAPITATELSQIERYIGLFGGLNIPLV